jgi:hypothetical protein
MRSDLVLQLLVTHHVELVLPGAHYLVRMLDGRIDTQGTIGDLRSRGVLKAIVHESPLDLDEAEEEPVPVAVTDTPTTDDIKPDENKKPRKLVKDEHREGGVVKWFVSVRTRLPTHAKAFVGVCINHISKLRKSSQPFQSPLLKRAFKFILDMGIYGPLRDCYSGMLSVFIKTFI